MRFPHPWLSPKGGGGKVRVGVVTPWTVVLIDAAVFGLALGILFGWGCVSQA